MSDKLEDQISKSLEDHFENWVKGAFQYPEGEPNRMTPRRAGKTHKESLMSLEDHFGDGTGQNNWPWESSEKERHRKDIRRLRNLLKDQDKRYQELLDQQTKETLKEKTTMTTITDKFQELKASAGANAKAIAGYKMAEAIVQSVSRSLVVLASTKPQLAPVKTALESSYGNLLVAVALSAISQFVPSTKLEAASEALSDFAVIEIAQKLPSLGDLLDLVLDDKARAMLDQTRDLGAKEPFKKEGE